MVVQNATMGHLFKIFRYAVRLRNQSGHIRPLKEKKGLKVTHGYCKALGSVWLSNIWSVDVQTVTKNDPHTPPPPHSQLLGHKGGGSIFSLLRREGLAHHVVATHKRFDLSDFSFMLLTIQVPILSADERKTADWSVFLKIFFNHICL